MRRSATKTAEFEYAGEDAVTLTPEDSEDMVGPLGPQPPAPTCQPG